jgi:hypothetical protein
MWQRWQMKVYLVGDCGPEHDSLYEIYLNKDKALAAFQELRLNLLEHAKNGLQSSKEDAEKRVESGVWYGGEKMSEESIQYFKNIIEKGDDMYLEMIKNLSEEDPEKIDNYPQETPYIKEQEVIE